MFLFRAVSFLVGYVIIFVTGDSPEKFVNLAASRGIYLWDITRIKEGAILLGVRLRAVKALRHIARRTRCRFKVYRRVGLPFYFIRLRRRKALVFGAVFFLGALYFLTSFVWFLEVKGNERLSTSAVLEAAKDAGLTRGSPKWKVEPGKIEVKIQEKLPLVSWTGVYIKGTRVTIEVAERTQPQEVDRGSSSIVSTKAGLIKEVLVIEGNPVVKEGDTVSPGQVLISGEIPPPEEPPAPGEKPGDKTKITLPVKYVHARGIVRARVWREGYGEANLVETGRRLTGRQQSRFSIKFQGKEIILIKSHDLPFGCYETQTFVKRMPEWRNISLPVELITVKYLEAAEFREVRSREEAKRIAREYALQEAAKDLPRDARMQGSWIEEVQTGRPENLVRIKAVIETIEDIGTDRPLERN